MTNSLKAEVSKKMKHNKLQKYTSGGFIFWLIICLIIALFLVWEVRWLLSMQILSWRVKVSEVAEFVCKPTNSQYKWTTNSVFLKWKCLEN